MFYTTRYVVNSILSRLGVLGPVPFYETGGNWLLTGPPKKAQTVALEYLKPT